MVTPGTTCGDECVEHLGGKPAGAAHAFERFRAVELDDAVARFEPIVGGDGDVLSHGCYIGICAIESHRRPRERKCEDSWTAALVVIGDEILSGRTQDKNVAQVATWLNDQGIRLAEVRIVPDDIERIGEAVNALRSAHDYVFTTGGIGPTHDDITVDAIAAAFGVPVVVHPRGAADPRGLLSRPAGRSDRGAAAHGARAPGRGADPEPDARARPGVRIDNVYIMAGVPYIAASMLEALTGKLEGGRPVVSVTVGARAPESDVADLLRETEAAHPGVAIGSYPVLQGRPLRRQLRDPVGGRAICASDGRDLSQRLRDAGFEPVDGGI